MSYAPWRGLPTIREPWEAADIPVEIVLVYGQSRAGDHSEGTAICYPAMVGRTSDRLAMLNNVRAPGGPYEADFVSTGYYASAFTTLTDCRYGTWVSDGAGGYTGHTNVVGDPVGQSLASMAFYLDAQDVAAGRPLCRRIFIAAGVGGRTLAQLSKGAAPWAGGFGTFVIYDRLRRMVQRAVALASALWGQSCRIGSVLWLQGEAEFAIGTTQAAYTTGLLQLISDLRTDLAADTGNASPFPFIMDQVSSDLKGGANPASLAQDAIAAANADGWTYSLGASYGMPFNASDPTGTGTAHMTAQGVVAWGEAFGMAREAIRAGTPRGLCRVTSASRVGNVVTLQASVPVGSLVIDTTTMPDPGSYGFKLRDTGGATISSVAVSGSSITVTLSQAPAGGATLEYAHENPSGVVGSGAASVNRLDGYTDIAGIPAKTAGAWGCIRDQRAEVSPLTGIVLRNPLCIGKWAL